MHKVQRLLSCLCHQSHNIRQSHYATSGKEIGDDICRERNTRRDGGSKTSLEARLLHHGNDGKAEASNGYCKEYVQLVVHCLSGLVGKVEYECCRPCDEYSPGVDGFDC